MTIPKDDPRFAKTGGTFKSLCVAVIIFATVSSVASADAVADVERLFEKNLRSFDFARIKFEVDQMIDPSINVAAQLAVVDQMVDDVATMFPAEATGWQKVEALRRYIYQPGPWNDGSAFRYDHDDPYGLDLRNKLMVDYLEDRAGNCITMPLLFVLIGQRLGLDMTLALAPLHVLVKFTDDQGVTHNLEATSGAGRARDQHYRELLPITDAAVSNGVYLAPLAQDQTIAVIAAVLVENLIAKGRYQEAMDVSDVLLDHHPNFAYVMVKKATASYYLMQKEFAGKNSRSYQVPDERRARLAKLQQINQSMFARAEELGWVPMSR